MTAKTVAEAKPVTPVARSFTPARSFVLQRKCACGSPAGTKNECECGDKKPPLQRKASGPGSTHDIPSSVSSVLNTSGHPLDSGTRSFMESRFGHDFGGVRIHSDSQAAESARDVDAQAYTVGQDVVFGSGKYQPDSHSGRELLAHELAHTVQQRGLQRSASDFSLSPTEDAHLEREADAAAAAVMRNDRSPALPLATQPVISRQALSRTKCSHDGQRAQCGRGTQGLWKLEDPTTGEVENYALDNIIVEEGILKNFAKGEWLTQVWTPPNLTKGGGDQKRGRADGAKVIETSNSLKVEVIEVKSCSKEGGGCVRASKEAYGYVTALNPLKDGISKVSKVVVANPTLAGFVGPLKKDQKQLFKSAGVDLDVADNLSAWQFYSHLQTKRGNKSPVAYETVSFDVNHDGSPGTKYTAGPQVIVACKHERKPGDLLRQLTFEVNGDGGISYRCDDTKCGPAGVYVAVPGGGVALKPPPPPEIVTLRFGSTSIDVSVPAGWIKKQKADDVRLEGAATTLIPGFLLEKLTHGGGKVLVSGTVNDTEGKLPVKLKHKDKSFVRFTVPATGDLKLVTDTRSVPIDFALLSPGAITKLVAGPNGLEFAGWIQPTLPMLGKLNVEYKEGKLSVIKGLEEATLKKKSLLGMRLTKAEVSLQLAPTFKPEGRLEMQLGQGDKPVAKAFLKISADSLGLIGEGKLSLNIPKMESSEVDISYKGGSGRNEWKTEIHIKSEAIQLGSKVSVTGGFDGLIEKGNIKFTGKINATFPGNNTAELGLKKEGPQWVLFGGGTFRFPKIDPTTVKVHYLLGKDILTATGKTGFKIPAIGLSGELTHVTFVIAKDAPVQVSGEGVLDFKKGKAAGHAKVKLQQNGKFTGKGSLSYQIKENIVVTGGVELDEKEKLRITGELLITRYEIFREYKDKKDIFTIDFPIPVPGLSIGKAGVVFHVRGGVGAEWSFGPGTLEPLKFSAGFDPLEEDPDLELAVTGSVKVPASATLSAWISGSAAVQVDVGFASAGVEGGLKLQGDLILRAGAFANFDAAYKKKKLTAKLVAGIDSKLLLGITLTAFVRAWAGAFGLTAETRKDWTLAKRTIDTRLGFYISAPFEYADGSGVKIPEFKDITLKKPEVTADNMKRILGEIFGQADEKKTES